MHASGDDCFFTDIAASPGETTGPARAQQQDLRGDGQSLHFHATDPGLPGTGEWLITGHHPASPSPAATARPTSRSAGLQQARWSS